MTGQDYPRGQQQHSGSVVSKYKVLLAGVSWLTTETHIKRFHQFPTATYHTGAGESLAALEGG